MISTLDAVIFVTILSIAATAMIGIQSPIDDGFDLSSACDDIFGSKLPINKVVPDGGDGVYAFYDLAAMSTSTNDSMYVMEYVYNVLHEASGGRLSFDIMMEYRGATVGALNCIHEPTMRCERSYVTMSGFVLHVYINAF